MVFQRLSRAYRALRAPIRPERKRAPYMFPLFVNGQPQWHMDDFMAYVREGYDLNSVIYSAVNFKARAIAKARLRAYAGDVDNPEPLPANHPLSMLLARPNPYQSWVEYQQQRETFLNIAGNSYTYLDRPTRNALPTAMYNLRPDRMYIVPDTRGIKGFYYKPEGAAQKDGLPFLPQDVIHVKFPNPKDPLEGLGEGLSPMAPMAQSGDVDNAVTAFLKLFFERGAMMSGLIKTKSQLDDDGVARIKRRWQEQYGGFENWGDIGVLDVDSDYQRLGLTFKEMGFNDLDSRNESRMLGPFGVPPILIFTRYGLERSTFSNAEEARAACWEDTLSPELDLFHADDEYYLRGDDGAFVLYDTSRIPALQRNTPALIDSAFKLWSMGMPANLATSTVGLRAPDIPGGDIGYLPVALMPVGGAPVQTAPTNEPPDATDDEREDEKRLLPKADSPTRKAQRWSEDEKARLWKQADDIAVNHEDAFRDEASTQFERDKREILALVSDAKKKSLQRKAAIQWEMLLEGVQEVLQAAGVRWREAFTPLISGVVTDAAEHWRIEAGLNFSITNPEAQDWFNRYILQFADPITSTSEREIAAMLQLAQQEGWSVPQMQRGLETMFQQWIGGNVTDWDFADIRLPPWRTEMIARTETIRSYAAGSLESFRGAGVEQKEWLSTLDDRTRDTHMIANGQVRDIDMPFNVGGYDLLYPGDFTAPPEETVFCRCSLLPVIAND